MRVFEVTPYNDKIVLKLKRFRAEKENRQTEVCH